MEWWQIQEIMWTAAGVFAVVIVASGFTLRFAIKPFLRDLHELRDAKRGGSLQEAHSDQRLERIEDQLERLDGAMERLLEVSEFDRQLKSGRQPPNPSDS